MFQSEDIDTVESVLALMRETPTLTELEIRNGNESLRICRPAQPLSGKKKASGASPKSAGSSAPRASSPVDTLPTTVERAPTMVTAHLVGIFHPAPKEPVAEGMIIRDRQVLGQIESMRLMNDCVAPSAGKIVSVLVEDGQPVEYGQPLFLIDPEGTA